MLLDLPFDILNLILDFLQSKEFLVLAFVNTKLTRSKTLKTRLAKHTLDAAIFGAAFSGCINVLEWIIVEKKFPFKLNEVVPHACSGGQIDTVEVLVKSGWPLNGECMYNAVCANQYAMVCYLHSTWEQPILSKALNAAARLGHFDIVKYILSLTNRMLPAFSREEKQVAIINAMQGRRVDIAKWMAARDTELFRDILHPISIAVRTGDVDVFKFVMDFPVGHDHWTRVHYITALRSGSIELVKYIVEETKLTIATVAGVVDANAKEKLHPDILAYATCAEEKRIDSYILRPAETREDFGKRRNRTWSDLYRQLLREGWLDGEEFYCPEYSIPAPLNC
jgi:hypothetical protein